jgi:hypothetical protein
LGKQNTVTGLLRAKIVEPEGPAIARQRPINNNNEAVISVQSKPAMASCNKRRAIGGGVFYWVYAEAL